MRSAGMAAYLGVDISGQMLGKFPAHDESFARLICGDLRDVLTSDEIKGTADVVVSSFNAICYADPATAIRPYRSALKAGGLLLLTTNVHVPKNIASRLEQSDGQAITLDPSTVSGPSTQRGLLFRHLLELGEGQTVPLQDYIHTGSDYADALSGSDLEPVEARIFKPIGCRMIDPQDSTYKGYFPPTQPGQVMVPFGEYVKLCLVAKATDPRA